MVNAAAVIDALNRFPVRGSSGFSNTSNEVAGQFTKLNLLTLSNPRYASKGVSRGDITEITSLRALFCGVVSE
jgi:hypothetical protein